MKRLYAIPREESVHYLTVINRIMDITLYGINEGLFADPQFVSWYDSHMETIVVVLSEYIGEEAAIMAVEGYVNNVVELAFYPN